MYDLEALRVTALATALDVARFSGVAKAEAIVRDAEAFDGDMLPGKSLQYAAVELSDAQVRTMALEAALRSVLPGSPIPDVLKAAQSFHDFLIGRQLTRPEPVAIRGSSGHFPPDDVLACAEDGE